MKRSTAIDPMQTCSHKAHSPVMLVAVACLIATLLPEVGRAQNGLQDWPSSPPKPVKFDRTIKPPTMSICRNGFDDDNTQAKLESYLRDRFFPDLINNRSRFPEKIDPKFDPIGKMRLWLNPSGQPANPEVYQTLAQVSLEQTKAIISNPEIYPPARIEAVLIMGELNVQPAREQLLAIVLNRDLPDALRVAALTGLTQQARQGWMAADAAFSAKLVAKMILLAGAPVPEGPKADFWRWMHGQAADVLGAIKWSGIKNAVPDALLKMVVDERKNPKVPALMIEQRCQAAKALGQLNYGEGYNAESCIAGLTHLARDVRTSPHADDRRFLRARLGDVVAALGKLSEIATGDAKNQAAALKASLQADCEALETTKPDKDKIKIMNDSSLKMIDKYLSK